MALVDEPEGLPGGYDEEESGFDGGLSDREELVELVDPLRLELPG